MKTRKSAQFAIVPPADHYVSAFIPRPFLLSLILAALMCGQIRAESVMNYTDSQALIDNNCPYIKLTNFWFGNRYERNSCRFVQSMTWTNIGTQPVVAFEIVILRYDAFNQRINGQSWTITGTDIENWTPLKPGFSGSDMTYGLTMEEVFTSIAYVRTVRLKDGTIWRAGTQGLPERLRKLAGDIEQFGNVTPDIKIYSASRTN
jgi:hypothetical protein